MLGPRGEEADVGVQPRGRSVVVAGADVDVAANLVVFLPDDEAELAMGLQLFHAVDDVHARVFKSLRPLDVAALVESRLQLHEHRDLLAALGRFDEPIDDRRVGADAVERHLDGDDARIVDGRIDERLHRLERVEGMVDQLIAIADLIEDVRRSLPPDSGRLQRLVVADRGARSRRAPSNRQTPSGRESDG